MECLKNFYGSIFINRDKLKEAGIEYPIKVEYYKVINESEREKENKLIYGIQVIKTEYKDKISIEQSQIKHITNNERQIENMLEKIKQNEATPVALEDIIIELEEDIIMV